MLSGIWGKWSEILTTVVQLYANKRGTLCVILSKLMLWDYLLLIKFQYARPMRGGSAAFDDVIKAQEDEQRLIREAEAYARGKEPIARGQA